MSLHGFFFNISFRQIEKMEQQKAALSAQFDKINAKDVQIQADIQLRNKKRKKTQEQLEDEQKKANIILLLISDTPLNHLKK